MSKITRKILFAWFFCWLFFVRRSFALRLSKHLLLGRPVQFRNSHDNFVMSLATQTHTPKINKYFKWMQFNNIRRASRTIEISLWFDFVFFLYFWVYRTEEFTWLNVSFVFVFAISPPCSKCKWSIDLFVKSIEFYLYSTSFPFGQSQNWINVCNIVVVFTVVILLSIYRAFYAPLICVRCRSLKYFQVRF